MLANTQPGMTTSDAHIMPPRMYFSWKFTEGFGQYCIPNAIEVMSHCYATPAGPGVNVRCGWEWKNDNTRMQWCVCVPLSTYGIGDMVGRRGDDGGRTTLLGDRLGGGQDHTGGTGLQHDCTKRIKEYNIIN